MGGSLGRLNLNYETASHVQEFCRLAIAIAASKRSTDMRTQVRAMSPRLDQILADVHDVYNMTPQQIRGQKSAVLAGSTTDATWAQPLAAYQMIANAFAESLRGFGAFDAMLAGGMRRVPLHARVGMSTMGFTPLTVGQGEVKPISKLSISGGTLDERKAVVIAVVTDELARFSSVTAGALFQTELQNALAVETDETFVEILTSGATSFGSSGVTAENVRNDLRAALGNITTGSRSRLFLIVGSAIAKVLAVLHDNTGGPAFPGMAVNGGEIGGITAVVSDGVPAGTMVLVDATQIAAGSETITLDASNETSLQLDTSPDSPPSASTNLVSLWQNNLFGLRAERWWGATKLSTAGVCVVTGVNYTGDSPGP